METIYFLPTNTAFIKAAFTICPVCHLAEDKPEWTHRAPTPRADGGLTLTCHGPMNIISPAHSLIIRGEHT